MPEHSETERHAKPNGTSIASYIRTHLTIWRGPNARTIRETSAKMGIVPYVAKCTRKKCGTPWHGMAGITFLQRTIRRDSYLVIYLSIYLLIYLFIICFSPLRLLIFSSFCLFIFCLSNFFFLHLYICNRFYLFFIYFHMACQGFTMDYIYIHVAA